MWGSCTTDGIGRFAGAFSLCSGTLGAAFSSSLSGVRSIALSYGHMAGHIPTTFHDPAFEISSKIMKRLINNWGPHNSKVLYSINIPMVERLLHEDGMKIYWTSVWRSSYGRLFAEVPWGTDGDASGKVEVTSQTTDAAKEENLVFEFDPDLSLLLSKTAAPEGSDSWALNVDAVSVTPYLTSFAELPESEHSFSCLQDREWKFDP